MLLRISDRYIIKSFLFSFFVCLAALVSLFIIVDTFSNLNNIVNHLAMEARRAGAGASGSVGLAASFKRGAGQFIEIVRMVLRMNVTRLPLIFYVLLPVLILSASMFTVVRLKRANEITPLLASGVSIYRVIWPLFLMAIVLTIVQVADREILIPRFGEDIREWDRIRTTSLMDVKRDIMMEDGYGNIIFAGEYRVSRRTLRGAQITRYWERGGVRTPMLVINAQTAAWRTTPTPGWVYANGTVIQYDFQGNVLPQMPFGEEGHFVPLRADAANIDDYAIVTDATPEQLESRQVEIFYWPTLDLLEYVHDHGLRGDIALDLNKRIAAPLSNAVLLLLGLPFVLKRNVKSPFLAIVLAVGITGVFFATGLVTENFALEGRILTPLTGAWAPIIIFGPVGVLLFDAVES